MTSAYMYTYIQLMTRKYRVSSMTLQKRNNTFQARVPVPAETTFCQVPRVNDQSRPKACQDLIPNLQKTRRHRYPKEAKKDECNSVFRGWGYPVSICFPTLPPTSNKNRQAKGPWNSVTNTENLVTQHIYFRYLAAVFTARKY